jgi:hypothetical protein
LTKPLQFPNAEYIVEAMARPQDLIGHQACLDFARLASTSKERRSEFFVISQPGRKWFAFSL